MYDPYYIHSEAIKLKDNELWAQYKRLRNKVTHEIKQQKRIIKMGFNVMLVTERAWESCRVLNTKHTRSVHLYLRTYHLMLLTTFFPKLFHSGLKISGIIHLFWTTPELIFGFNFSEGFQFQ